MSPYQRIIKDGEIIQEGEMDTPTKFAQLTQGIDLAGKTVLDVGCNTGMMCYLAAQQGANVIGFDINRDYIKQAKELFPTLDFQCVPAEEIYGNYDIIIASAMLHYVNLEKVLAQFSRCSKQVLCDVWLHESQVPIFALTQRDIYIPSMSAFYNIASKYFETIEEKGMALSPDDSRRFIFHLSNPKSNPAKAVLI
ncbi:MAG: class I SAM-dependent methyltransferase, partial [Thermoplasmata archaeon]|nr:class I SAM-dependent methyltransferase [Thermoplasmata archaeon]